MNPSRCFLARACLELGLSAQNLIHQVDSYWFNAPAGSPLPPRLYDLARKIEASALLLEQADENVSVTATSKEITHTILKCLKSGQRHWRGKKHQALYGKWRDFQECADFTDPVAAKEAAAWWQRHSPRQAMHWHALRRCCGSLAENLKDELADCFAVGALTASSIAMCEGSEDEHEWSIMVSQSPINDLQDRLFKLRNGIPGLSGIDIDLSDSIRRPAGVTYFEWVASKVTTVYEAIRGRLLHPEPIASTTSALSGGKSEPVCLTERSSDWGASDSVHKRITKEEANIRAREILQKEPWLSQRELANKIPCSTGLVGNLPAYRAVRDGFSTRGRIKRPKAVHFSPAVEATLGRTDNIATLARQQEQDAEPSPLDPEGGSPRRNVCRKHV
jgi:hypothetical protein